MINYSIVKRSVNSDLIDINRAKGRIKAAEAAGETPSSEDVALVATEKQNAYAIAQYADVMTIEKFSKHISEHGCVYSRADIAAVLYMAVDCLREQLLEGKKIRLGDLGDFSVSISSKGTEKASDFNASCITGVKVIWDCGDNFKNLYADAEFNLVASRAAQAALLKAIKAGQTTVDLNATSSDDGGDGNDDNTDPTPTPTPSGNGKKSITLTVSPEGAGTVTGAGQYDVNSSANISAVANSGYQFVRWNDGETSPNRTITVTEDKTFNAIFTTQASGDDLDQG